MNYKGNFLIILLLSGFASLAQSFELVQGETNFTAGISQTIRIPIQIKNTSEKAQFYIIRLNDNELSSTQKGYFCWGKTCLEPGINEFSKKIEAGATLEDLHFFLETGLITGQYPIKFEVFTKGNIQTLAEREVNVLIEGKQAKSVIFQSKDITIHDIYPNPVVDQAFIDYRLHNEAVKAKLIVHNILGSAIANHELAFTESKVKIQADELTSGVYFYTLYLDNIGVLTRKLVIRR